MNPPGLYLPDATDAAGGLPCLAWRIVQAAVLFLCLASFGAGLPLILAIAIGMI